jgi:hypothetical protein
VVQLTGGGTNPTTTFIHTDIMGRVLADIFGTKYYTNVLGFLSFRARNIDKKYEHLLATSQ